MIDEKVEKKAAAKAKADVGKKMGHVKSDAGKAKALQRK